MADLRPGDKKPKGAGNPSRINRLLVKKTAKDYAQLTNVVALRNLALNSEQTLELRAMLHAKKTRMQMVTNRLSVRALADLGLKDADKLFAGPTYLLNGDDPVTTAKLGLELVTKYNKALKLTGGVLDGKVLNAKDVETLSRSKTRVELLGDVVGLALSPGARVAAQLKGPGGRLAGALKALVEKLEKSAGGAEAASKPA
jgi:large subunit ribosomal protein L10